MENQVNHLKIHQEDKNKIVIILMIAFFLSLLFQVVPIGGGLLDFFILSDQKLTFKTYSYFLLQDVYKCALMMCVYIIFDHRIIKYFLYIQFILLFDYLVTYNSVIFELSGFEFSIVRISLIAKTVLFIKYLWEQ